MAAMRIVGGALGGRTLHAPEGLRVRPTSDKARQAIFNILAHGECAIDLEGAHAIDLFAGTGALGLEAISRGAAYALFVDDSAESRALIRRNVEAFGLTGATRIWRRDATALGPMAAGAGGLFQLAFLDPPYRKGLVPAALASLRGGGWLAPGAIAVAEMGADEDVPSTDGFAVMDSRLYGETRVVFLRAG
ncbi:MAG TPA: 16S rRNA (guanine(966)-N(2))-methyltransferase RsmD [Rhizomicrobium sp.]|nr:16S rRNA (guanine(966)-N(2))-methyltransferase RsmD [Rhizomicrobium sp.]